MIRLAFFASLCARVAALRIPPSSVAWSPALPDGSKIPRVENADLVAAFAEPDPVVVPLSWDPRIFLIRNFLSSDECDHIVRTATPLLQRSTVVDGKGGGMVDPIRNSAGTFLRRRSDDVISRIEDRLAKLTMLPVANQEDMQVLRYEPGQHYSPHTDYFSGTAEKSAENGLQRIATILMYLNSYGDEYTGGETIFPLILESAEQSKWENVSKCTRGNLAVRPRKGDAVLFWSLKPDGSEDPGSTHGSCDVIEGVKYSAPIWLRQRPFHPQSLPPDGPRACRDEAEACEDWAAQGECEKNAGFMSDKCRKACKLC
jgi:prolyl 4-hydroxylase